METLRMWRLLLVHCCLLLVALSLNAQGPAAVGAKVKVVDGTTYPRTSQGIQAAIRDIGSSPGTVVLTAGSYDISSEIQVSQLGIRIVGAGPSSTLLNVSNPTADVFNVSGDRFEIMDLEFRSTVQKTGGSVIAMNGSDGQVHNVRMQGNFWNGLTGVATRGGGWSIDTVRVVGPASWNYFLHLSSPSRTIASTHFYNIYISNNISWKTASVVLDTGVDTFLCSDAEMGPVLIQSTLGPQAPRWVRFTNVAIEAGVSGKNEGTGMDIEAVRDLRFVTGYIASSQFGVEVGPGARGVDISHVEFVGIGRSGVAINAGAHDVLITHNTFEDTGIESNNAFDSIAIAQGATDFTIAYNSFKTDTPNHPRYNLLLPAKCATCVAEGNRYGGALTGSVAGGK